MPRQTRVHPELDPPLKASWFQRYLLPGIIFQSAVIAGGYGTGREIVEFFLSLGPVAGLASMAVSTFVWSVVAAASFEFARRFKAFEYRRFFQTLLGRAWPLFEITYVLLLMLVLAVIGAAAGAIAVETFGLPYASGVAVALGAVGALLFYGSSAIERAFAGWSFALYAVYAILLIWSLARFGPDVGSALASAELEGGWFLNGIRYAGYNLSAAAVALFAVRHIRTRREAVTAGLLAGPLGMLPALLFYFAMVAHYPQITSETVPANYMLEAIGSRTFQIVFQIVLFGTLIETGTGLIHAVNERVAATFRDRGRSLASWIRPAVGLGFLGIALLLTPLGLVDLIAAGYGTITWGFVVFYIVPVLTIGLWRLRGSGEST
ncbi:MAG: hypothetical protein MJB57_06910 [Gemmatimonadetes bacterium]|nr:hypothetical protein [Gemmatimonadota bacterium]